MEHIPVLIPIWSGEDRLPEEIEAKLIEIDERPCAYHLNCLACGGKMRPKKMCEVAREFICENGHETLLAHLPYGVTIDMPISGVQHCLSVETIEAINSEARETNAEGLYEYVQAVGYEIIERFPELTGQQMLYLLWQCVPNIPSREFALMLLGVPMDIVLPAG